jgi:hypothetical protein
LRCSSRARLKQSLEIDFVHQHACTNAPRQFTDVAERFLINKGVGWIMKIRECD